MPTDPVNHSPDASRRESPRGTHFYLLYRQCPRKFYFKYPLGLKPRFTSRYLLRGTAIHNTLASNYEHLRDHGLFLDVAFLQAQVTQELLALGDQYEDRGQLDEDIDWALALMACYHATWATPDESNFQILEVEQPYEVPLGPPEAGFSFSLRPDLIVRDRQTGITSLLETKTTSWSITQAFNAVELDQQVTAYLWAITKLRPDLDCSQAIPNILYRRGTSEPRCSRPSIVVRIPEDLQLFELQMYGTILEVTQKWLALAKYPWPLLFPMDTSLCCRFGCEYQHICPRNITPDYLPPGFLRDPWHEEVDEVFSKTQHFSLDSILKEKE